jgi:hypothetical protein
MNDWRSRLSRTCRGSVLIAASSREPDSGTAKVDKYLDVEIT